MQHDRDSSKIFFKILNLLTKLDVGALLFGGLFGLVYIILHFSFTEILPLTEYQLGLVIVIGLLIGSGLDKLTTSTLAFIVKNKRLNEIKIFANKKKLFSQQIDTLQELLDFGFITPKEASERAKILLDQLLLDRDGIEQLRLREATEQGQIQGSASEEE
jgi:hypothetical protein